MAARAGAETTADGRADDGGLVSPAAEHPVNGSDGGGKTYVIFALCEQACQHHVAVKYWRLPRLLDELNTEHANGSYRKQLLQLSKKAVLIFDDSGLEKLTRRQSSNLPEVIEDRYGRGSMLVISQLPVPEWYKMVSIPTVADALMDRMLNNSHRIELRGELL